MKVGAEREAVLLHLLAQTGQRTRALNGNIANVNTPGYKRREVTFEGAMRQALARGDSPLEVRAVETTDETSPARIDGNNVDLERELAEKDANGLLYDAYLTLLESHYRLLDAAVQSGR